MHFQRPPAYEGVFVDLHDEVVPPGVGHARVVDGQRVGVVLQGPVVLAAVVAMKLLNAIMSV